MDTAKWPWKRKNFSVVFGNTLQDNNWKCKDFGNTLQDNNNNIVFPQRRKRRIYLIYPQGIIILIIIKFYNWKREEIKISLINLWFNSSPHISSPYHNYFHFLHFMLEEIKDSFDPLIISFTTEKCIPGPVIIIIIVSSQHYDDVIVIIITNKGKINLLSNPLY